MKFFTDVDSFELASLNPDKNINPPTANRCKYRSICNFLKGDKMSLV